MRSSKIFSKSIKSIVDHRDEYNKKPHSFKAKAYEGSNQKESGAEEGLPLIRKAIKKVLVVNGGAQEADRSVGVLNITKKSRQIVLGETVDTPQGSFTIFIRNLDDKTTEDGLHKIINDRSHIQGISISGREAYVTFTTQQSADAAVEQINKSGKLRAVVNYQQRRVIEVVRREDHIRALKNDQEAQQSNNLRMDRKESIFDRIKK